MANRPPEHRPKEDSIQLLNDAVRNDESWRLFFAWVQRQMIAKQADLRSASDVLSVGRAQGALTILDRLAHLPGELIQDLHEEQPDDSRGAGSGGTTP